MPGGAVSGGTVSVVIPTYHRPDMLGAAARSVLAQQVLPGWDLELVIAVSDAASVPDRRAADEIAATDTRVKVAVADRLGPGSARNAGIAVATGNVIALLDDDCQAQPGWLVAGLTKLDEV